MAAPAIRGSTAAVSGGSTTSPAGTAVDDLVIVVTWERNGAGSATHTLQSGFTEIFTWAHDDGSTDGRLSVAYKKATSGGANAYAAYTSSSGTEWWTGCIVLKAGTFDESAIASGTATTGTTNAAPDPPSVTLNGDRDYLVLAIAGWHLSASATVAVTAPSNYNALWDISGAATGELAVAWKKVLAPIASADPGAFGDDVAPNGTARNTIAIPNKNPSDAYWVKKVDENASSSATSLALTVPASGVAAGQLLIVTGGQSSLGTITSVTDSRGNTYAVDVTRATVACGSCIASCIVGTALQSGDTITVNFSGAATFCVAACHQFAPASGKVWQSGVDKTTSASSTSTTPSSGATATLSEADELCIGAVSFTNTTAGFEPDSGWTALSGAMASGNSAVSEPFYKVVAATTAVTASGVLSASIAWNAVVATYRMDNAPVTGTAVQNVTVTSTAAGLRKVFGACVNAVSVGSTAVGLRKVFGTLLKNVSVGSTVTGLRKVFGSSVSNVSVGSTVSGVRKVLGACVTGISVGSTAIGLPTVLGVAVKAITVTSTAIGSVTGGVPTVFGTAVKNITVTSTASGLRTVYGACVKAVTVGSTAVGLRKVFGTLVKAVTVGSTIAGLRKVFGSIAKNLGPTATASGSTPGRVTGQPGYKSLRVDAGLSLTNLRTVLNEASANGAQHIRFAAQWQSIETSDGVYTWTKMDQMVDECEARNLEMTVHMIQSPTWVTTTGSWKPPVANNTQLQHWKDWCTALAGRFGTRIQLYEIWNEPNGNTFWASGSAISQFPTEYAKLLKWGYEGIKAGDPDAQVGGINCSRPLVSGYQNGVYDALESLYGVPACQANNYYFDYLSLHPYDLTHNPTIAKGSDDIADSWGGVIGRCFKDYERARDIVTAREGAPKPIYMGEWGHNTDGSTNNGPVSDAVRATYLTNAFTIIRNDDGVYALTPYAWKQSTAAWDIDGTATETAFINFPVVLPDTILGTAESNPTVSSSAVGKRTVRGVAAKSLSILSTALGQNISGDTVFGTAAKALAVTATAVGHTADSLGTAVSSLVLRATARGHVTPRRRHVHGPALTYSPRADTATGYMWPIYTRDGELVWAIKQYVVQVPYGRFVIDRDGNHWRVVDLGVVEPI